MGHSSIGPMLLKEWNIPDVVCNSLEYQCFPEYFPPSEIPEEHRKNVAVLYIAHLCYERLNDEFEDKLPLVFIDEYIKLLDFTENSFSELLRNLVIPTLNKKINTFPEDVRQFLLKSKTMKGDQLSLEDNGLKADDFFKLDDELY